MLGGLNVGSKLRTLLGSLASPSFMSKVANKPKHCIYKGTGIVELVIDLSKIGVIVVREIDDSDETDVSELRDGKDYWFKTPYGDVLYACGLDQLRVLLGMVRVIEQSLISEWIYLIQRINDLPEKDSLTIEVSYGDNIGSGVASLSGNRIIRFNNGSQLLTGLMNALPSDRKGLIS